MQIPKCGKCNIDMILREKNGEKFFGCQNWKNCHSKTVPYYAVETGGTEKFVITEELWGRMEIKLDWIIDNLKHPESEIAKILPKFPNETMQSLKEILNEQPDTPF